MTTLVLKTKTIVLLGADKRRKTLAVHDLGKNLFKSWVWVETPSVKDNFLM